jgi:hypothetical protein
MPGKLPYLAGMHSGIQTGTKAGSWSTSGRAPPFIGDIPEAASMKIQCENAP